MDYYDDLLRIAIGRLYWTPEYATTCDVNAILVGYEGQLDLLQSIFGSSDNPPKPVPGAKSNALVPISEEHIFDDAGVVNVTKDARGEPIQLSPNLFDAMFRKPPQGK